MATMVRIDESLHAALRAVADQEGRSIGKVLEDAFAVYQRDAFWSGVREDYARLRDDQRAYSAWQRETALLDSGAADTLLDEPPYYTAEEEAEIRAALD